MLLNSPEGLVGIALNTDNFKAAPNSKHDVIDQAFRFHVSPKSSIYIFE